MFEISDAVKFSFYRIARDVFNFDFDDYLKENNRELFGITINADANRYDKLFGNIPENLLAAINTRFNNHPAGYKVNVASTFETIETNTDLLLVRNDILFGDMKLLDALLLHELCHAVIDSSYIEKLNVKRNVTDDKQGEKLFEYVMPDDNFHDLEFCQLLSYAANIYKNVDSRFKNRQDVIDYAMKFDKFDF
jgi:hypothetical protein